MSTRRIHRFAGFGRTLLGAVALVALAALAAPQSGYALTKGTAANNIIRNTVTVDYNDTAGTAMDAVTDTVDVTVILVASTPTLSEPVDQSTDPNTAAVYNYTLTATANGPDTYDLAVDSVVDSADDFASASAAVLSETSLTLGATSVATAGTIAAIGNTVITVPSDNTDDGAVNGIAGGDKVVINGYEFVIDSVDDTNNGEPGTSTITVIGDGTNAVVIAIGDQIGERQSFTLTVTPGELEPDQAAPTITVIVSAEDDASNGNGAGDAAADTDETVTSLNVAALTPVKEVSTDNITFAASASAAPGATLYYKITVTNNGSSNATSVVITDPVPQFTTYVEDSTLLNGITVAGDGTTSPLEAGLTIDANDSRTADALATGILAPGASAVITYQITIDN